MKRCLVRTRQQPRKQIVVPAVPLLHRPERGVTGRDLLERPAQIVRAESGKVTEQRGRVDSLPGNPAKLAQFAQGSGTQLATSPVFSILPMPGYGKCTANTRSPLFASSSTSATRLAAPTF